MQSKSLLVAALLGAASLAFQVQAQTPATSGATTGTMPGNNTTATTTADPMSSRGIMSKDQIKAQYDAAKERCDALSGNEKDVCEEKAKADRDKSEADLDAAKEKAKADYKVAKEKCDAMSGDAKDACMDAAKAQHKRDWD